ncbi:MAG: methionine synthase [Chloroflexi bacterium]|nr:MAG: methionine synthase [Chloroflexota bacterium]
MSHEQRFVERLPATNYQQMGMAMGVAPEEWVFDEPDKVRGLHAAFIDAGADIILTDTFGGSSLRLRESRYAGRATELNRRAAELAREASAARDGVLVAGSMGPTGMLMEPLGELTATAAADAYREQAAALEEGGVDLLLLETFFALDEALAAIEGIRRASTLPLAVTFSFDRGTRTMMGLSPTRMVEAIAPLGVAAIGANCGRSLNAGLPRMVGDVAHYETGPAEMADYAMRFVQAGARVIGGCCGTSPEHMRCMTAALSGGRVRFRGQD